MNTRASLRALLRAGACAAVLAVAGCAAQNGNNWNQVFDMVSGSFDSTPSITLDQAAGVPYASLGVRVGDGPQFLLVMAADEGQDKLWTSKARFALTTRAGRVVRSAGLPKDIDSLSFRTGDAVMDAAKSPGPHESLRFVDFRDLNRYSVPLHCVAVAHGQESVTILGKSIAALRVDEECASEEMDWNFTDSFWIGSTGLVWKSIQHTHPDFDPLELEVLRPPASTP